VSDDETDAARDADHLRILVVLGFAYAVVGTLIHAVVLRGAVNTLLSMHDFAMSGERVSSRDPLGLESGLYSVVIQRVLLLVAGISLPLLLGTRRPRALCAIAAFLVAWDAPAGTVLGVLVLLVLARPSVAIEFEAAAVARGDVAADPEQIRRDMIRRAARRHARERRETAGPSDPGTATAHDEPPLSAD
jgi:hypothetical protein